MFTGGAGADTFVGSIDTTAGSELSTMSVIDNINGGAGIDTLKIASVQALVTANLANISNIEIFELESAAAITLNTSAISGVTDVNVLKTGGAVAVTAGTTTNITESVKAFGAATTINGGKNVTVKLTDVLDNTSAVTIGGTAAAAGTVAVEVSGKAYDAADSAATLSNVTVTGGTSISVIQKAAASITAAAADTAAITVIEGDIAVNGNASTTDVVIKQDATVAVANATFKTGGVTETASVTFGILKAGDVLTVAGLTLTATVDMTAAEVAAAFSGLVNGSAYAAGPLVAAGDTQGSASAAKGVFTNVATGWTSGAVSGSTVVFTSTTANSNLGGDLTPVLTNTSGSSAAPVVTTTQGSAHNAGASGGKLGVTAGLVSVADASGVLKNLTIEGYKTGSALSSGGAALSTLNLAGSDASSTLTIIDTADTLALNLSSMGATSTVAFTAAPLTLNVKSTGNNTVALTAAATTALNVSGTGTLTSAGTFTNVKSIVVTETAGLNVGGATFGALESITATGTTGAITASINGVNTTYAGSAGVDTVTLLTGTALTKSIDLGAGDDTLVFGSLAVTGSTATLSGGAGTDTLSMTSVVADGLDGAPVTFYTNFERLLISNVVGATDGAVVNTTLDLANLGFTNYVSVSGTNQEAGFHDTLTLNNLANNGTLGLTSAAGDYIVGIKDAATGTADVLNIVTSSTAGLTNGVVTAANVETVKIATVDTQSGTQTKNTDTLTLTADKATSVSVSGAADVTLTLTGSTKVTTIDGTGMTGTGGLTVTSVNTTSATTFKGGAGNDVFTAATGTTADVLLGGAGDDTLIANAGLDTLTGGAGNDLFVIATASLNSSSYATITDFAAGDLIKFTGASGFVASKVTQGDTAVFQDYANAAVNSASVGAGVAAWFQFAGNTYVVMDAGADSTAGFVDGQDFIVKLTGLVDLTNASFNNTSDTIAL